MIDVLVLLKQAINILPLEDSITEEYGSLMFTIGNVAKALAEDCGALAELHQLLDEFVSSTVDLDDPEKNAEEEIEERKKTE